ncbi:MAG: LysR family transcriptional regulator [Eubacteriales bacterium]|nr:LysR family transcriptional regulator [Eubacteriales bacterium]
MISIKNAECIMTILRSGNFTNAAKNMYISQPALSQAVRKIEEKLGAAIFDRSTEPITLTEAGQIYLDALRQVMAISTRLSNSINEIINEKKGRLRLGISLQRGMQLLPLVIPDFSRQYPHVKIDLLEHGSAALEKLLHDGMCDIALITTNPRYDSLEYILLKSEEIVLMSSLSTGLAEKFEDVAEISISEAAGEKFVSLIAGHSVRVIQDQLLSSHHINPSILLETDSLEAAKRLTAAADAVMLCPYVYIIQSPEVRAKVKCFRVRNIDCMRHFYLSYPRGVAMPRFMMDFMEIVKRKAREDGSLTGS